MTLALLTGAGVGLGLLAILRGLFPPRPPLATLLAQAQPASLPAATPDPAGSAPAGLAGRLGHALARLAGALGLALPATRQHLAVTGQPLERHLAEKVFLALFGLLLGPATTAALALTGYHLPAALPVWAGLLLAAGGFALPGVRLRADAAARRREARHALGALLDLTVIGLAGGAGIEGALADAAAVTRGWPGARFRHALAAARLRREPPWAALARLGGELGVPELGELAASVGLAGAEGARVRASLAAKAASLRAHRLADAEAEAQAATERMSLPVVLLFAGFLLFIGYPAVARVLSGI